MWVEPMLANRTKGKALDHVRERLKGFVVPEFILLSCGVWHDDPESLLDAVQHRFGEKTVVVRSSATDEDGEHGARAGEYDSVLGVVADDRGALRAAITAVIASYASRGNGSTGEEILVQEMVRDVVLSGVVFTHELNTGAPYYVVNYDDTSGLTNTVTSGAGEYANRPLYIHRGAITELRSGRFQRLLVAVSELEQVAGSAFLDIEFALDERLQPYLLQFRAITTVLTGTAQWRRIDAELRGIQTFVRERLRGARRVWPPRCSARCLTGTGGNDRSRRRARIVALSQTYHRSCVAACPCEHGLRYTDWTGSDGVAAGCPSSTSAQLPFLCRSTCRRRSLASLSTIG